MKIGIISNVESCIPLLQYLRSINIETVLYIGTTNPETNSSSLISFCLAAKISFEVEIKSTQLYEWLHLQQPNKCFVYGYKKLIDIKKLGKFQQNIFNIHPGKLPNYRGSSPIFWQLKNGEVKIGIAIHFLNDRYDEGAIVWQKEIANEKHFSYGLVEMIFANLLIEGVHYVISKEIDDLLKQKIEQNEKNAIRYFKPLLKDVMVDWHKMNASKVVDLVKACNPWNKGAITLCNNMEIKIIDAEAESIKSNKIPGTIVELNGGVNVVSAQNSVVKINEMNINGIFVPSRFANKFGLAVGHCFETPH